MRCIVWSLLLFGLINAAFAQQNDTIWVKVRQVNIKGNEKTKERIILRELDIVPGDSLLSNEAEAMLEKNRRKIFNTNLFVSVHLTLQAVSVQEVDLQVEVREQWYIFPFPVFQLADRNFNEWWFQRGRDLSRTVYGVNLRHRNFRGRAEELRLNLEFGFAQFIEFFYRIPYIDKAQKTGITLGVSYSTTKNLAYRTDADRLSYLRSDEVLRDRFYTNVILRRRNKFYDFQFLELRYAHNGIADTVANFLNSNYLLGARSKQQFFQLSYTYIYDFRDRGQYPLRGYYFWAQAIKYGLLPTDDLNQLDLVVRGSTFQPLSKRWFLDLSAGAKVSFPQQQPFLQTRGLGYGRDLVRGYELYAVDGQSYAYLRNTLRYQLFDKTLQLKFLKVRQFNTLPLALYPNLFTDVGFAHNSFRALNNSRLANKLLLGTGLGFDVVSSYNVVLRLSYAFNIEGDAGVRFSLMREF